MTVSAERWLVKKAARAAVMLGSTTVNTLLRSSKAHRTTVRVLTYHRFGKATRDPWCVDASTFEEQMRWLGEKQLAVSLDEVLRFARGEIDLADGSVLITMDDGFSSVATVAGPIMKRYGIPGVAYITTSLVNSDNTTADGERYLTWEQVARLPEYGLVVGSHAHTHSSLGKMRIEDAAYEGANSKTLLEANTGLRIESFAYPFGMRPDESPATARALNEAGYSSVFIAQHGVIRKGSDILRLPRVKVEGGENAWMFRAICEGGMDAWKLFDDTLWRLQRPET